MPTLALTSDLNLAINLNSKVPLNLTLTLSLTLISTLPLTVTDAAVPACSHGEAAARPAGNGKRE